MTVTAPLPVIGFLGAGQMAAALGKGFVTAGVVKPDRLMGYDISADSAQRFAAATGGKTVTGVADLLSAARLIFLSVKPQHMQDVLTQIRDLVTADHLLVSIAAGQSLTRISAGLPSGTRLVRVMPNTPCLVGEGASGFAMGPHCRPGDSLVVETLLATTGLAVEVPEKLLDAVTGLSGSGPAYVYQIIEALSDGGVRMGLPRRGHAAGGTDGPRFRPDGAGHRPASGAAQGCGNQSRRHHDCRPARTGTGRTAES